MKKRANTCIEAMEDDNGTLGAQKYISIYLYIVIYVRRTFTIFSQKLIAIANKKLTTRKKKLNESASTNH